MKIQADQVVFGYKLKLNSELISGEPIFSFCSQQLGLVGTRAHCQHPPAPTTCLLSSHHLKEIIKPFTEGNRKGKGLVPVYSAHGTTIV